MARKLIGTGVTDANGEATITYTGTGAGKLNIVAESGTFVSEIYSVLDCSWMEDGTYTGYGKSNNVSITEGVVANSSSSTGYLTPSLTGTTVDTKKWNTDLMIEFDFTKGTNNIQVQLNDGTNNISRYLTTSCNVKIQVKSTGTFFIFDDGTPVTDTAIASTFLFRFIVWAESSNTIQNLKIYPI